MEHSNNSFADDGRIPRQVALRGCHLCRGLDFVHASLTCRMWRRQQASAPDRLQKHGRCRRCVDLRVGPTRSPLGGLQIQQCFCTLEDP